MTITNSNNNLQFINKMNYRQTNNINFKGSTGKITDIEKQTIRRIFSNLEYISKRRSGSKEFEYLKSLIIRDMNKIPQDSDTNFIQEALTCINNAPKDKMFYENSMFDRSIGSEGAFLLATGEKRLLLRVRPNLQNDKEFMAKLKDDISISKQLMEDINNGNWERINNMQLENNHYKF